MTIVSSGAISFNSLVGEYGATGSARALTHYYRGGQSGLVANHSNNSSVPTSGTIALSNFYGQSNTAPNDTNVAGTCGGYQPPVAKYSDYYHGINATTDLSAFAFGSWSDTSFTNPAGTTTFTITLALTFTSTLGNNTYIAISGNYGGQNFPTATGHGTLSIGGTGYWSQNGSNGIYISSHAHTRWAGNIVNNFPTSGYQTFTWS